MEKQKITNLISKCENLQKNGKYSECIEIMKQIIDMKKTLYGKDDSQVRKEQQKLCERLNFLAMVELQKQQFDSAINHLKQAQQTAKHSPSQKAITYNNMACYYRMKGKIRTALSYLNQALQLQLKIKQSNALADTHLNLCAVLSQLDRHEDAVYHSMLSVIFLQDQFLTLLLSQQKNKVKNNDEKKHINSERLSVLAIGYHNLGVELQYLKQYEEAVKIYSKALQFSRDNLSNKKEFLTNISKVVNNAMYKIQKHKQLPTYNKNNRGSSEPKKQNSSSSSFEHFKQFPQIKKNNFNNNEFATLISNYQPSNMVEHNTYLNKNKRSDKTIDNQCCFQEKQNKSIDNGHIRTQRRMLQNRTKKSNSRIQAHSELLASLEADIRTSFNLNKN